MALLFVVDASMSRMSLLDQTLAPWKPFLEWVRDQNLPAVLIVNTHGAKPLAWQRKAGYTEKDLKDAAEQTFERSRPELLADIKKVTGFDFTRVYFSHEIESLAKAAQQAVRDLADVLGTPLKGEVVPAPTQPSGHPATPGSSEDLPASA